MGALAVFYIWSGAKQRSSKLVSTATLAQVVQDMDLPPLDYGIDSRGIGTETLPFSLKYFMTKAQVENLLGAFSAGRIDSGDPDVLAYSVPDQLTGTTNALMLVFSAKGLVEISSMKRSMSKPMYEKYLGEMREQASAWRASGMNTVMEDDSNAFYLYKDSRSYVEVTGTTQVSSANDYRVTVTFSEATHFDKDKR